MDYDQVWCVFDRDSFPSGNFNNAIKMAGSDGFHCAYTNEAFELWYLLHFEYHITSYSRTQYKDMLGKRLGKVYNKNDRNIYDDLKDKQPTAIRNAEKLLNEYGERHNPENNNPCTTVHKLVQILNKYLR